VITEDQDIEKAVESPQSTERSRSRLLLLIVAAALLIAPAVAGFLLLQDNEPTTAGGMGGPIDSNGQVADFSEIQLGDIVLEFDGSTATLLVTTSIDVVCAVAYGPTAALGLLATDTDMAGGGHSDHHPMLPGLEAGEHYSYRLQGVGADGTLYASELMTFVVPSADGSGDTSSGFSPESPNVAVGAAVTSVSSEFSDSFAAHLALDGDLATEWSSAGDGDEAFIEFDLGETMVIEAIGFRTRQMSDGTSITTSFTVDVDAETHGPFDSGPGLVLAPLDAVGRLIRVDVHTSTGGNTGAIEVEVFGEPLAPPPDSGMGDG
jgi:hypothetical protein